MYCKNCGKEIGVNSQYCKFCGNATSIKSKVIDTKESVQIITKDVSMQDIISCPKIAKISAIYTSGISEAHYSGSAVSFITPLNSKESSSIAFTPIGMSGYSISELSKKLAPPIKPQQPSNGCFIASLIVAIISTFPLAIFGLISLYFFAMLGSGIASDDSGAVGIGVIGVIFIPIIISFAILTVVFWVLTRVFSDKIKSGQAKYKNEMPVWQKSMSNWDKLYYCFRNDVIFNPKTSQYTQADNIEVFF